MDANIFYTLEIWFQHEIAYALAFKYPQHFTRLFKQRVEQSPDEYRSLN